MAFVNNTLCLHTGTRFFYLFLIFFSFTSIHSNGQSLILQRGKKTKEIPPGTYLDIYGKTRDLQDSSRFCCQRGFGVLERVSQDSLYIKASFFGQNQEENGQWIWHEKSTQEIAINAVVPLSGLSRISLFKSPKHQRNDRVFDGFGGMLIITGIATTLHVLVPRQKSDRNVILASGGIQVGLGILLASFIHGKRYNFDDGNASWRIIKK